MAPVKLLHFADVHLGADYSGPIDPETNLPARLMDFLWALDFVVEKALEHRVDLVLFAGDAFHHPMPNPTLQREWAKRIVRLTQEGVPVVLLVGNHDRTPSFHRAHVLELFRIFPLDRVRVIDRWRTLGPDDLFGLPLYLIGLPWLHRATLSAWLNLPTKDPRAWHEHLYRYLDRFMQKALEARPEGLPVVLLAHAMVPNAEPGVEQRYNLDFTFTLPGTLVRDPRLDYVALGHVHKHQALTQEHPLVVYAGSVERVDFSEAKEKKGCVLVEVAPGRAEYEFLPNDRSRRFVSLSISLNAAETATRTVVDYLRRHTQEIEGAVVRLYIEGPEAALMALDMREVERAVRPALTAHIIRRFPVTQRLRLQEDALRQATPLDLLEIYWKSRGKSAEEYTPLQELARRIMDEVHHEQAVSEAAL